MDLKSSCRPLRPTESSRGWEIRNVRLLNICQLSKPRISLQNSENKDNEHIYKPCQRYNRPRQPTNSVVQVTPLSHILTILKHSETNKKVDRSARCAENIEHYNGLEPKSQDVKFCSGSIWTFESKLGDPGPSAPSPLVYNRPAKLSFVTSKSSNTRPQTNTAVSSSPLDVW